MIKKLEYRKKKDTTANVNTANDWQEESVSEWILFLALYDFYMIVDERVVNDMANTSLNMSEHMHGLLGHSSEWTEQSWKFLC